METIPSKQIVLADVPETDSLTVQFEYNFFTPDESLNETGSVPPKYLQLRGDKFDTVFTDTIEYKKNVPRANRIRWQPKNVSNNQAKTLGTGNGLKDTKYLTSISIYENLSKLNYEDSFTANNYSAASVQNHQLENEISTATAALAGDLLANFIGSPQDAAKEIKNKTKNLDSSTIAYAMNALGLQSFNFSSRDEILNNLKLVPSVNLQINNKIIGDLLAKTKEDDLYHIQNAVMKTSNSNVFSMEEYELQIDKYITTRKVDLRATDPIMQVLGYIIEKYEILADGSVKTHSPIIVENPNISNIVDIQVKYGARYYYNIRTVAYMETVGVTTETNESMLVGFLLASKPIRSNDILCVEKIPPQNPVDFIITWDYKINKPRLTWNFPVNTQRDIKYFQVFRRRTVYEPFELIKQFDFNDSLVKLPIPEALVDEELVEKLNGPIGFFTDIDFDDKGFIYAVAALDAHGASSNYSMQLKAVFSRGSNKLRLQLVSVAGAPKPYPNAFINVDTFVDTIKDEGHHKVTIAFDPEYLKVLDSDKNDLGLLATRNGETYQLQFTNIDLQEQQIITVTVDDKTDNQITKSISKKSNLLDESENQKIGMGKNFNKVIIG